MYFNMAGEAVMLICLAVGYGVLCLARRQEKGALRTAGNVIGIVIIALSVVFFVAGVIGRAKMQKRIEEWKQRVDTLKEQHPPEVPAQ